MNFQKCSSHARSGIRLQDGLENRALYREEKESDIRESEGIRLNSDSGNRRDIISTKFKLDRLDSEGMHRAWHHLDPICRCGFHYSQASGNFNSQRRNLATTKLPLIQNLRSPSQTPFSFASPGPALTGSTRSAQATQSPSLPYPDPWLSLLLRLSQALTIPAVRRPVPVAPAAQVAPAPQRRQPVVVPPVRPAVRRPVPAAPAAQVAPAPQRRQPVVVPPVRPAVRRPVPAAPAAQVAPAPQRRQPAVVPPVRPAVRRPVPAAPAAQVAPAPQRRQPATTVAPVVPAEVPRVRVPPPTPTRKRGAQTEVPSPSTCRVSVFARLSHPEVVGQTPTLPVVPVPGPDVPSSSTSGLGRRARRNRNRRLRLAASEAERQQMADAIAHQELVERTVAPRQRRPR
ncbi:uncharacterized protein LOC114580022 [Dendrobium catenatum]|uniref:uncharacterized protein LOC114580022 n=1 Tax=Dendrobium catenatum TaxID=906689 RepID=UPI00109F9BC7|nr:uncharacterized protein LOC114580022 [Dendrobium catenatum]